MENQPKQLKSTTIGLMIGTSVFYDVLGVLLFFVYPIVTFFAYMTFWLWFTMKGIKLLTPKRATIQGGTILIELIPIVSALPAITAMVVLTILTTRIKVIAANTQIAGRIGSESGDKQNLKKAA